MVILDAVLIMIGMILGIMTASITDMDMVILITVGEQDGDMILGIMVEDIMVVITVVIMVGITHGIMGAILVEVGLLVVQVTTEDTDPMAELY